ncbi:MAG: Holliday junction resolvase RuvX [Hahellaceae bacterium]|jgi:putative Holliday junction resolvase|nr:Holliday junction resolvase RuvX [Hahellaceae bacterium]
MADPKRVMAFDFGTCRIGVAVGQQLTGTASPLKILPAKDGVPDWGVIGQLIQEWKPDRVLVGHPLNMDGTENEMCVRARKFANRLHGRFGVQVELVDERLSSFVHREQRRVSAGRSDPIDALAAATICEDWLRR